MIGMAADDLVLVALALPAAAALIIPLFRNHPNLREAVTLVTATLLFATVLSILPHVLGGEKPAYEGIEIVDGVAFAFRVEALGMLFALIASGLWIVNSIYSIGYMRGNDEKRQTGFYVCFAIALCATMGIAFSANLLTLFLFYEILTISTYPLVIHKGDAAAMRGGRIYLGLLLGTSMLLLLPAIFITYALAGTLDFRAGGILPSTVGGGMVGLLFALYLYGIGKAALMPLHFWLPAAMVAPTPVSALLHAVAVVKAGVFTVTKVAIYIFGIDRLEFTGQAGWATALAGTTVIAASLVALRQDNLKKRLAYSTVSQLSYVILGVAVLAPISLIGAAMHIAAHAVSKITLFFAAGSIHTAAHLTEISQLDGIGRRMPWTMGAFAVGAISMIGLPPTAGFLGKWFILTGAMETSNWLAVTVIVTSTVLNALYFLPIVYRAFFREPAPAHDGHAPHGEAPWPIVLALTITATATIVLFLAPDVALILADQMLRR